MNSIRIGRLLILFAVAFSLSSLSGLLAKDVSFPTLVPAHAALQQCMTVGAAGECSDTWYPSGPSMGTEQATIFGSVSAEYNSLLSTQPGLDLTDAPCAPATVCQQVQTNPNLTITSPVNGNQFGYCGPPQPGILGPSVASSSPTNTCGTWTHVINGDLLGLPNYFTWLNTWNHQPAQPNTIRQAFVTTTRSVNPYIATTLQDFYIVGNIYDSLFVTNPLNPAQAMDWMDQSDRIVPNIMLIYLPPLGTVTSYRFTLIPGLTFQDGTPVTSFDVAFSYLSLLGTGAYQSAPASPVVGITILGPRQFDLNVNTGASSALANITGLSIMPGRYWVGNPSAWNNGITDCTGMGSSSCYPVQYTLSGTPAAPTCALAGCASFPAGSMQWNTGKTSFAFYDPLANGILIGSGPWQCGSGSTIGGPGCSSTHSENPAIGGSYTLTANPSYVRSSNNLALLLWASNGIPTGPSFLTYSFAAFCFNSISTPVGTSGAPSSYTTGGSSVTQACSHWQEGIGGPSGTVAAGTIGASLSNDPKITYVGGGTFAFGDPIIYNVAGGSTYQSSDIVISNPSSIKLIPAMTVLSGDPLLKFYDNPALGSPGVWVNGKGIIYDTDNSGGYDFGDISSSSYSNGNGNYISPAPGINIPAPPPGGCPASASSGCWLNEGSTQVGIVALRVGLNFVQPFNWATSPPTGIGSLPPPIYQPGSTLVLNPGSVASCTNPFSATSPTSGGYDC